MRKVKPIKFEFEYEDSKENEVVIQRMYNRIFDMARRNVLSKRVIRIKRKEELFLNK